MRLGLISDVHANAPALRTVLDDLRRRGIERVLCAGDVVGYYPFPNETVEMLEERGVQCIQGNHDRSVLRVDTSLMNPWARDAVEWTAAHLEERTRRYLAALPVSTTVYTDGISICLHHGSPRDPIEYVYEERATADLLRMARCTVLVLGHTHVPFVKEFPSGLIVNPGSVGQPRDGDPRASYSVLDTREGKVTNHRLDYDIDAVARKVDEAGLPRALRDRLYAGY